MYDFTEKHREFHRKQAKTRPRHENGHFKKTRKEEAGLIIVTCLPTRRQYVAQSLNVYAQVNAIRCRMRKLKMTTPQINEDLAKYGIGQFRLGIGETIRRMAFETQEEYEGRLHALYSDYIKDHNNLYETQNMLLRTVALIERKSIDLLGKTKGKQNHDIACPCVYVLTCKKTGKHYVGATGNFYERWRRMVSELSRGVFHCEALQGDWNEYGNSNFVCDYVRVDRSALFSGKKATQKRLGDLHCY